MRKFGQRLFAVAMAFVIVAMFGACSGKGSQIAVPAKTPSPGLVSETQGGVNPGPEIEETFTKYIVVLKPQEPSQTRDSLIDGLTKPASHLYNTVFVGFAADISVSEFDALSADGRVAYVEEEVLIQHCAPLFENNPSSDPWGIVDNLVPTTEAEAVEGPIRFEGDNPADWGVSRINAFPSPGLQGAGITVAIIDTGIDTDHPDLAGALVAEYDAVGDLAGPGTAEDLHGHGTHVAGIVGARDNDIGTVGVAPECSFAAIKVFPGASGGGSDLDLIRGIDWMAANHNVVNPPIKVANMSLSGTGTSRAMYDAIQACNDLGITTVVAAGNDFRDAAQQMPANFDNVITVSAMKRVGSAGSYSYDFAMFSNWGNCVDLIAPGQSILSLRNNGATRYMSGTSMACPHVAGAAALYLDENLGDGFQETYDALVGSGETGTWDGDPDGVSEPLVDASDPVWHTLAVDNVGGVGRYTSMLIVNGMPAISYGDYSAKLKYVRATSSNGSSWGTPITVDTFGVPGQYTSLAVVNGNPAISYWNGLFGVGLMFVRATDASGSTWEAPVDVDLNSNAGTLTSLEVVDGNPAIAYYDGGTDNLEFVRAIDPDGSTWAAPRTLDSFGDVGCYLSLAIVDGNPAVSYYDKTNDDLKFIRASDPAGNAWGAPMLVNSTGGSHTSLEVVNGNPAISYHGGTSFNLMYVRATSPNGSTWGTPQTVDASGDVGLYTSLAIVGGNPAICYQKSHSDDLKYVQATDLSGGTWGTPVTVDAGGNVGQWTSLVEVNGNPGISYCDNTNGDLKFAYYGP